MKVKIYTLGCKVNQFESQAMYKELAENGFDIADNDEFADISIINSCAVTHVSEQKAVKLIHRIRRESPDTVIVLTGCMAQAFPESGDKLPEADIILGNKRRADLLPVLKQYLDDRKRLTFVEDYYKILVNVLTLKGLSVIMKRRLIIKDNSELSQLLIRGN